MTVAERLAERWAGRDHPFLIHPSGELTFQDVAAARTLGMTDVQAGDVVALIGDFDPASIATLLDLIDRRTIVVPLSTQTAAQHGDFFEAALVDVVIEAGGLRRLPHTRRHPLVEELRRVGHAGLVLFSSGTTGRPKAILHDLTRFMQRFETPRPTLRTLSFLLFDHIGGLNTLFHTLFNRGTVVAPASRGVESILASCREHHVELLPATPTFLRLMLMSGLLPDAAPASLELITYGTERMDQPTLDALCDTLPRVDFRQTFGMSELGIVRVKSESRRSLFMKIGGEGVRTRVIDGVLEMHSANRMLGYLNADSPFDPQGWYRSGDLVEQRDGYYRVTGRTGELINVGGLKFMASEVEMTALGFAGVELVKAQGCANPITGQHVELCVQASRNAGIEKRALKSFLASRLPAHMVPQRITLGRVPVGHRCKRA